MGSRGVSSRLLRGIKWAPEGCQVDPVPFRDIFSQQSFSQGKNSNTLKRLQSRVIRELPDSKDELIVFLCKIMI